MFETANSPDPWVTFCMTTYRRPDFLREQLRTILKQTFSNFHIIISDNDLDESGRHVVDEIGDSRVSYFNNQANLGMITSFNNSLRNASSEYVVMITDDDPVYPEMLSDFFQLSQRFPGYPVYLGACRSGKKAGSVEVFNERDFTFEILHPRHTTRILWSSCILKRSVALEVGGMPDYGSPHLADHALILLCGRNGGGVVVNKIYGHLVSHTQNFSKRNFDLYYDGCVGFFKLIRGSFEEAFYNRDGENVLIKHLENWFITNSFSLRWYFTYKLKSDEAIDEINRISSMILRLDFMSTIRSKYYFKLLKFTLKKPFLYLRS